MTSEEKLRSQSIDNCLTALALKDFQIDALAALHEDLKASAEEIKALHRTQVQAGGMKIQDESIPLRIDVRDRLLRIQDLAIVALRGLPGIKEDVRVPHKNADREKIVAATTRIIKNVRPHLATLQAKGLSKDFILKLERDARTLAEMRPPAETPITRRSRATASLPDAIRRGREIIAALDRAISGEIPRDTPALKVWNAAKRIPGKPGRPRGPRKPPRPPAT